MDLLRVQKVAGLGLNLLVLAFRRLQEEGVYSSPLALYSDPVIAPSRSDQLPDGRPGGQIPS